MKTLLISAILGLASGYAVAYRLVQIGNSTDAAVQIGGKVWIAVSLVVIVYRLATHEARNCPPAWKERGLDKEWWQNVYQARARELAKADKLAAKGITVEHRSGLTRLVEWALPRPFSERRRQEHSISAASPDQPAEESDPLVGLRIDLPNYAGESTLSGQLSHSPAQAARSTESGKAQREAWNCLVDANRKETAAQEQAIAEHNRQVKQRVAEYARQHGPISCSAQQPTATEHQRARAIQHHSRQLQDWERSMMANRGDQFANQIANQVEQEAEQRGDEFAEQVEEYVQEHGVKGSAWLVKQQVRVR